MSAQRDRANGTMPSGGPDPQGSESSVALELLRRAATLKCIAACFRDPREGLRREVLAGVEACAQPAVPLEDLARAWRDGEEEAIREAHCRLFLGSAPCPPNETAWGDARRLGGQPVDLADIRGFYRAFGFDLAPSHRDMPDCRCAAHAPTT